MHRPVRKGGTVATIPLGSGGTIGKIVHKNFMADYAIGILVADGGRAVLYGATHASGELEELEDFVNPEGQLRPQEYESDSPGRTFDSKGEGRHAMAPDTDPHQAAAEKFSRLLAGKLQEACQQGRIARVGLVAAPRFLGHLRSVLDGGAARQVVLEVDKNLTHEKASEVRAHLPAKLFS
jgi:protein required for attachment to host cells